MSVFECVILTTGNFCRINAPRKDGGLGEMNIPLLANKTGEIAPKYDVYNVSIYLPTLVQVSGLVCSAC